LSSQIQKPHIMTKYLVTDIEFDTDGEELDLPTSMTIEVPDDIENEYDIEEYISDEISNISGFCHFGFHSEKVS